MLIRIMCVSFFAIGLMAQQPETAPPPAVPASYRISGTVVDAVSLAPLVQTKVAIAPVTARNALRTVVTGEDGRFVFDNVTRGKYSLEAQQRGYALQGFEQHEGYATAIAAGPGLTSDSLVFRLRPDASISGKIMDGQNEPVSNDAQVMLFQASVESGRLRTRARDQVGTDDQGYFHFPHLPPGKYFVAVSARPWYATYAPPAPGVSRPMPPTQPQPLDVAYPVTFYPGVTEAGDATPIVLQAGDRFVADVVLRAVPAMRLRYKSSNTEGSQFLHLRLAQRFFGDTETSLRSQNEVGGGDIREIVGLAPGHYIVHVQSMRDPRAAGFARELDLTGNTDFDLEDAPASASVSGTVKFEGLTASLTPI